MTKEEAIKELKELRDGWSRHIYSEGIRKRAALDMAIEALEHETNDNAENEKALRNIIKHGRTAATCICKECGCEFRYTSKDVAYSIKEIESSHDDVEKGDKLMRVYHYVICPECCAGVEVG